MVKKSLLFLLLFALMAPWAANAQTVTIGTGTGTNYAAPIDNYYNYSFTEMLYSASEIGNPSVNTITSVGFESTNGANNYEYGITIFMKNIADEELGSSFVAVSSSDIVYSGTVTPTAGWVTIDLDNAFTYDNTQNLLIAVNKTSGSYAGSSYTWNYTTTTNKTLLGAHNDGSAYNPTSTLPTPGSYGFTGTSRPNVQLTFSAPASCAKPIALAVTPNGQSATLTWTSDASSFNVAYSADGTANPDDLTYTTVNTTSYTKDDLAIDADHYFWVRAVCSATDQSAWAGPASVHIGYCTPAPTSVDNDGITNVTFGTGDYIVNNDTPTATYADYSSQIGAVQAGVEATIAITFNTHYTYNTYVWVDLDNSLSFDADEVVCYGESASTYPTTLTLNFTIPADQTLGDFRMRIGSADSGLGTDPTAANPCYASSFGCFQDYTLRVLEAPDCLTPTGLALTTDGETVTATWNGTASTYNIDIDGTVTNNVTSPYTFACALSTTYTVKVQANCDGSTSDWSNTASITTPDCLGGRTIEYTLMDSYGDGWNGNAINIVDECGAIINSLTLASGSSTSGTLEFCEGYFEFVFLEGMYKDETSWTFTEGGVTLFEGEGSDIVSGTTLYTLGNPTKPTNLSATPDSDNAQLSWTENGHATAWQICLDGDEANLIAANSNPFTLTGLNPGLMYGVKVRAINGDTYTCWSEAITFSTVETCEAPTMPTVSDITPFAANVAWTPTEGEFEFRYRELAPQDNYFEDGTLGAWTTIDADGDGNTWYPLGEGEIPGYNASLGHVTSASYNSSGALTPDNYLVSPQVALGGSISFWACNQDAYAETIGVAVSIASNDDPADFTTLKTWTLPLARGGAYTTDSRSGNRAQCPWFYFYVDLSAYAGQTGYVAIRHYNCTDKFRVNVDNIMIEQPSDEWTVVDNPTSPVALTDLAPETNYEVEVRTACQGGDYSRWMGNMFTTPSNCEAPTDLDVTNLMPTTATLNWAGYQDEYQIQYRPAATYEAIWEENFENGLDNWTIVAGEDATYPSGGIWYTMNPSSGLNFNAHGGSYVASSWSWSGSAYNADNWLITPQLDLQGVLKYYVRTNTGYPDSYEVLLSTTTNETSSFTVTLQAMAAAPAVAQWNEVIIDLSAYAGQQGYIAFHHVDYDANYLLIDDCGIYNVVASEWTQINSNTTTIDLNLDPETTYEWQVRGVNSSCTNGEDEGYTPWSEIRNFTTPGLCDAPYDLVFETFEATTATLIWNGYQESYNVMYRTAETYDELFSDDFEEGVDGWTTPDDDNLFTLSFTDGTSMNVYGFVGDGTTQTMISPEFESAPAGYALRFFYYAYEASIQTFNVGFSTDGENFTYLGEVTTDEENYVDYYEVEVPEGAKYFAIQSSGASNYLLLGEFWIYANYVAPGEWVELTVTEPSVTMEPLTPETEYEVYVQGICGDGEDDVTDWVGGTFTTPEGATTVTQTLELTEGWNDISIYLEIADEDEAVAMLDQLKEALGEDALLITGDDGFTMYEDEEWFGDLDEVGVTNEQSYSILVGADCRVVLEGVLADPADHPITINPGWNMIGFPYSEEVEVETALSEFEAEDLDMLVNNDGFTMYEDEEWFGDIVTLVPGQGYLYFSNFDEPKRLIFQTTASKTRHAIPTLGNLQKKQVFKGNLTGIKLMYGNNNLIKPVK